MFLRFFVLHAGLGVVIDLIENGYYICDENIYSTTVIPVQNSAIMQTKSIILRADKLSKTFFSKKQTVTAVKGIDLEVHSGEIFGFLGPNGAGKSTTLDMLTTLLTPTSGQAFVCGFDLLRAPEKIRQQIGYVSQTGGADGVFNTMENLGLQARLYGIDKAKAVSIAANLVDRFQMKEFAARPAGSYSGGQKRRLELALGIVHTPKLLFLDEPTTGLDPQSRAYFWQEIKRLKAAGMTVFLTTHYLEEADNLCDRIAIVDHGAVIEVDTPTNMKRMVGAESIVIDFLDENIAASAEELFEGATFVKKLCADGRRLTLFVESGASLLPEVMQLLGAKDIFAQTIGISQPSLDDVFLQKTGRSLREAKG